MNYTPCLNCEKREVGCHTVCESYMDYVYAKDEERKKVSKARFEANPFNQNAKWTEGQRRS